MNKISSEKEAKPANPINWVKLVAAFIVLVACEAAVIAKYIFIRYAGSPVYPLSRYHYWLIGLLLIMDVILVYLAGVRYARNGRHWEP